MGRRPKVQKTPQEKWQIVLEGLKSGNIAQVWINRLLQTGVIG
ncbi:MAG: hypothetical protein ABSG52_04620 [Terriglobales bacterium]|jgi:hypothetical protein